MKEFTTRKYNGDDHYSWAVFRSKDVKGIRGVVFYNQAKPFYNGCSRSQAIWYAEKMNRTVEVK